MVCAKHEKTDGDVLVVRLIYLICNIESLWSTELRTVHACRASDAFEALPEPPQGYPGRLASLGAASLSSLESPKLLSPGSSQSLGEGGPLTYEASARPFPVDLLGLGPQPMRTVASSTDPPCPPVQCGGAMQSSQSLGEGGPLMFEASARPFPIDLLGISPQPMRAEAPSLESHDQPLHHRGGPVHSSSRSWGQPELHQLHQFEAGAQPLSINLLGFGPQPMRAASPSANAYCQPLHRRKSPVQSRVEEHLMFESRARPFPTDLLGFGPRPMRAALPTDSHGQPLHCRGGPVQSNPSGPPPHPKRPDAIAAGEAEAALGALRALDIAPPSPPASLAEYRWVTSLPALISSTIMCRAPH